MKHENTPQVSTVPITVFRVTANGDGFGVNDSGEVVYIPPSLSNRFGVHEDEERLVKLVPNSPARAETVPWRVYYVEPIGSGQLELPMDYDPEPEPAQEDQSQEDLVLDRLDGVLVMSTGDVAGLLGVPSMKARNLLDRMHNEGEVVRADVFARPGQQNESRSLWAQTLEDFKGETP